MNQIKINPLNQRIIELHKKYSSHLSEHIGNNYLPMFYDDFNNTENKILVSGINPSFSSKDFRNYRNIEIFNDTLDTPQKESIITELIRIQNCFKYGNDKNNQLKQIKYFRAIIQFAEKTNNKDLWDHFDLFPHRHTRQHEFFDAIGNINGYKEEAFEIFKELLSKSNYKVVCVFNGGATNLLLGKKFKDLVQFEPLNEGVGNLGNKKYGFYKANINNKEITFFLYKVISGMGQPDQIERENLYSVFKSGLNKFI